jgi:5'-nucleotidase
LKDNYRVEWYKDFLPEHEKAINILHFNDVYNIEGKMANKTDVDDDWEILGGVGRFKTAFDCYGSKDKLVVFSGDLFFPSLLSTHFEGEQMLYPFE